MAGPSDTSPCGTPPGDRLEVAQQLARACQPGAEQRHLFWVRAGAVLPSGGPLLGPWSEPAEQGCVLTAAWPLAAVLGLVAGALLLAALAVLAVCLCSRTKQKWVKMRDIGVNLPSGLERPEKGLAALRSSERRPGYGRLVSHSAEGAAATSGRPVRPGPGGGGGEGRAARRGGADEQTPLFSRHETAETTENDYRIVVNDAHSALNASTFSLHYFIIVSFTAHIGNVYHA